MISHFLRVEFASVRAILMFLLGFTTFFVVSLFVVPLGLEEHAFYYIIPAVVLAVASAYPIGGLYAATIGRRRSTKRANGFKASVEGNFLRIIDGDTDRKIHFREVVDYQTDRSGYPKTSTVASLIMSTTSGIQLGRLMIPAVIDPLATRDLLAEVDAQRENPRC